MWISKFFVHSTQHFLDNVGRDCQQARGICNRIFRQGRAKQNQKRSGSLRPDRCNAYKEALAECPKTPWERLCCRKIFAKPLPKCETKPIAEVYQETYNSIKVEANDTLKHIEKESKNIRDSLSNLRIQDHDLVELHKQLTQNVMASMQMLLKVQPRCGSIIRKEMLMLNDEAWRSVYALKDDVTPSIKEINCALDKLEEDASLCVEQANVLLQSCRSSKKHDVLLECIAKHAEQAMKILERIKTEGDIKLAEVRRYRDRVVKSHAKAAEEVTNLYNAKMGKFGFYLDRCIAGDKKRKK